MQVPGDRASEIISMLGKFQFFNGLSETSLETLARVVKLQHILKGQFLFLQGDPAEKTYLVRSGRISILLESPDGRRLVINEMHAGDFFGEVGLITEETRSSSALARMDCDLLVFPPKVFMSILEAEPLLVRRMLEMNAIRLRESTQREGALAFLDAQGRLARLLLILGHQELEKGYITISQEELAERTGQTRQTVAKALGRWRRAGWLITGRGRIMLLDYDALAQQEFEDSLL
jgi:CRP/FNR family cyclic AMP-dependent transcriptional regulator